MADLGYTIDDSAYGLEASCSLASFGLSCTHDRRSVTLARVCAEPDSRKYYDCYCGAFPYVAGPGMKLSDRGGRPSEAGADGGMGRFAIAGALLRPRQACRIERWLAEEKTVRALARNRSICALFQMCIHWPHKNTHTPPPANPPKIPSNQRPSLAARHHAPLSASTAHRRCSCGVQLATAVATCSYS